jgi:hypothetical protein
MNLVIISGWADLVKYRKLMVQATVVLEGQTEKHTYVREIESVYKGYMMIHCLGGAYKVFFYVHNTNQENHL